MSGLRERWDRYWFRPAALVDLAVARVVLVGFQLGWLVTSGARAGLREASELPDAAYAPLPLLRLLLLPFGPDFRPSWNVLSTALDLTLVAGALALVGLFTRVSLGVFAVGCVALQAYRYSFGEFFHPEAVLLIGLVALTLSPSGRALSLDRRWAARRGRTAGSPGESAFARWPLLLLQWLCVGVYLSAAASKLGQSGLAWMNGYTLQYCSFVKGTQLDTPLGPWLSQQHSLARALSWITILFEASFGLVMFWRPLAWVYLPLGVVILTSIYLTIGAPFFQLIAVLCVFVPWHRLLRA